MGSARLGSNFSARRRKTSACIPSCFSSSADFDTDEYKPATCTTYSSRRTSRFFWWSRFRAKKKTVPVDIESHRVLAPEPTPVMDMAQFSTENLEQTVKWTPNAKKPCIFQQMSSKCVRQTTKPSPITTCRLAYPNRSISSSSSIKFYKKCEVIALVGGKLNVDAGVIVLTIILLALLLLGRASAVVCVSVWFYLIPRLRTGRRTRTTTVTGPRNKKLKEADVGELRKRVVTQG